MATYRPPPLRSDLVVQQQVHRGEPYCIVKDPVTRRFFRLPLSSYKVARQFDGDLAVDQLAQERSAEEGCPADSAEIEQFARLLERLGLLDQQLSPSDIDRRQRVQASEKRSIFYLKWPLLDPDRLLARLLVVLRPLFTSPFVAVLGGLIAVSLVLYLSRGQIVSKALVQVTHGSGLGWLYAATALTLTLHELAHGLTSKHFGAEVREMGFLLLYFMPCAYTDISDAYHVPRKRDRLWITLAGSASDLLVWALASIVLVWVQPGPTGQQILGALLLTTGYRSVALNLNPLIKLDGYYVLVDLLEMPNLRWRSRNVIHWRVKKWLRRHPNQPDETARDRRVLELYGWLSLAYIGGLLSLTAIWVDRWLVGWSGPCGRLAYVGIAALLFLVRQSKRSSRRRQRREVIDEEVDLREPS